MKNPIIPGLNIPVRTIYCIGRNYAEHAKEMGHKSPSEPIVFLKPLSSICFDGSIIPLPKKTQDVHHEIELVLAVSKTAKNVSKEYALDYIAGYGIGVDLTARDIQKKAKEKGEPWSISKGFDNFAPIGSFTPFTLDKFPSLKLNLSVNGELRQSGTTDNMIFDPASLVSYLSGIFTLEEGDLIFTGTPEGVSALIYNDVVEAELNGGISKLKITIA